MTFAPDQPREANGRFGEKTGSAPDLSLSESAEAASQPLPASVRSVTDALRVEALDEAGLTLADVSALRAATNRAEYRLLEYEAEDYLAKNHPEVTGLLISFDAYSDEPYIAGVETGLPEEDSGRNYGNVHPLTDGYEDIREWGNTNSYYLKRFENEELFDEYGTVLLDENDPYGEFRDPAKGTERGLGLQTSARVYRFGERLAT